MSILVEDGSGLVGANSYASEDDGDNYCEDRALTNWTDNTTGDKEGALIRASAALDAIYRTRYPGVRLKGRDQGLEWPRGATTSSTSTTIIPVLDAEGNEIPSDEIPIEVIQATIELAVRELVTPGSAMPDVERLVKRVKAGSVEVEYAGNASDRTNFNIVDSIMSSLIGGLSVTPSLFGEAVRG